MRRLPKHPNRGAPRLTTRGRPPGYRTWSVSALLLVSACGPGEVPRQISENSQVSGPNSGRAALPDPGLPSWQEAAPDTFHVRFQTTKGDFVVRVNRSWAPMGADRFINLVDNTRLDAEGFPPLGHVVEGMEVVDRLYGGYGESSGGGMRRGEQEGIITEGNAYLDRNFPELDQLIRATILEG